MVELSKNKRDIDRETRRKCVEIEKSVDVLSDIPQVNLASGESMSACHTHIGSPFNQTGQTMPKIDHYFRVLITRLGENDQRSLLGAHVSSVEFAIVMRRSRLREGLHCG